MNLSKQVKEINWLKILFFYGIILIGTYLARKLPNLLNLFLEQITDIPFSFNYNHGVVTLIVALLFYKFGEDIVITEVKDQYYNMKEKVEPVMFIVDLAKKAMKMLDIKPFIKPIRGGTNGCRLSYMGLPCPNIFAGGHNFHGKYKYVPVKSMQKAVEVIIKIAELTATTDFSKK